LNGFARSSNDNKVKIKFALSLPWQSGFYTMRTPSNQIIMEQNKHKEIAARFYNEILNKGNLDLLNEVMARDFIDHNAAPDQGPGIEGFKGFVKMVTTAFPDLHIVLEDTIAEGNKVSARLTITGRQTGILMGTIPPSNKKATWTGIDILEIKEDKIAGRWSERNLLSMLKQTGAMPR
jgi:predicted ester cyclase